MILYFLLPLIQSLMKTSNIWDDKIFHEKNIRLRYTEKIDKKHIVPEKIRSFNTVNTHVLPFSKRLDNRLSKSAN